MGRLCPVVKSELCVEIDSNTVEPLFNDHPKNPAKAILKEGRPLFRDRFMWKYERKGLKKKRREK